MSNKKKAIQLGISIGKATHRLRKMIMFQMIRKAGLDICFQCGKEIQTIEELSIEHKEPWLDSDNPKKLFWDLDNIAFSHLKCNSGSARQTRVLKHPSLQAYRRGCRCKECTEFQRISMQEYRKRKEYTPYRIQL